MSKILKNQTASAVYLADTSATVPASGQYIIPLEDYQTFAVSDDVVVKVGDSTLVVNDGIKDLNIANGVNYIQGGYPSDITISGEVQTITKLHHEIHEGDAYSHIDIHTLGNNATYYFMAKTPNNATRCHLRHSSQSTEGGSVTIYEGGTVSNNGTAAAVFNRDRNSTNTNEVLLYHAPTVTSLGTQFEEVAFGLGGGSAGGLSAVDEYILKQDTIYIFKLFSNASANDIVVSLLWYEEH